MYKIGERNKVNNNCIGCKSNGTKILILNTINIGVIVLGFINKSLRIYIRNISMYF